MKEKETEKLIQKRVSTDTHITVDFDSSKSNQNSNSNSKKNTSAWTVLAILSSTLLAVMFAETMLATSTSRHYERI